MIERFVAWLASFCDVRLVSRDGRRIFYRYYVAGGQGDRSELVLHHWVGSDPAEGLHWHPWKWAVALILVGQYTELRWDGKDVQADGRAVVRTRLYKRFRVNILRSSTCHRVVLAPGQQAWTLFLTGPRTGEGWGFVNPDTLERRVVEGRTRDGPKVGVGAAGGAGSEQGGRVA